MRISDMHWQQVEAYLQRDNRVVLPLGCTEQHAYLSLSTDSILAERVAVEAAEPLGIPVYPVVPYGITPYFMAYPGTITLRLETYFRLLGDIFDSLYETGFRRIFVVNGHGGNSAGADFAREWAADHAGARVKWHNWWNAPRAWAQVQATDPDASHASWMENFPWTRLAGVALPQVQKPMIALDRMRLLNPHEVREMLGDGNFGGFYERSDDDMLRLWRIAIEEARALLDGDWGET